MKPTNLHRTPAQTFTPAHRLGNLPRHIRSSLKTSAYALLSLHLLTTPVAHAGIFDPLLRILLPSYQSKQADNTGTPNDVATDTITDEQIDDEPIAVIDDGQDDAYAYPMPNVDSDLPDIVFDDSLIADDSLPALDTPELYALLSAEFAADRGNIQQALSIYKAESFKKNATAVFERALSLSIEHEQPKQSLAFAKAWQAHNPDHIPAWFFVTHLALKAGDYEQAVRMLALILTYDPKTDLSQIFANILPDNTNDQQALFKALQSLDSDNPSVSVLRAGLLMRLGDYQSSLLHVQDALTQQPKNLAFINLKIDILQAWGQTDKLWAFLHEQQHIMPQEASLYLHEIRHLINTGELTQAWQLLLKAHQNTKNADITLLAGLVALDIGEHQKAIDLLKTLTKNKSFASRAHYYLGISYERMNNTKQALYHYEHVSDDEHVLDARTKVVGFYLLNNQAEHAMATLVRLRDEYEIYAADSYILQAEIYQRQNNTQAAKDLLTLANTQYPDDDKLLYASYQLLEKDLNQDEKRQAIHQLLALNPDNPSHQLLLAKLSLADDPDDKDALALAQKISQIGNDDPYYDSDTQLSALMVLAQNAISHQRYEQAIGLLQTPYELSQNLNAGILLLRAYQGLGDDVMVNQILSQLQARYGFDSPSSAESSADEQGGQGGTDSVYLPNDAVDSLIDDGQDDLTDDPQNKSQEHLSDDLQDHAQDQPPHTHR